MDTLQKILNSVQSGYLNKPDGSAAVLSVHLLEGRQWRGQLLEAGGL